MCGSAGGTCWGDGGVTSKLQKKLIKNEKKERRGEREGGGGGGVGEAGVDGSSCGWTEGRRGREKQGEENGEKVWKEGGGVLLKTGGQTVCNWLGPRGLKERFKERRVEGDRGQINR